jgi:hypothetical protein
VVLFGALLAPGILAGGLLAGQVRGFGDRSDHAGVLGGGGRVAVMAFEPLYVSAPARPQWVYGGFVPGVPREVVARAEAVLADRDEKVVVSTASDGSGGRRRAEVEGARASNSVARGGGGRRRGVEVEEPYAPVPVRPREGCPGEWEETWLWEVCRAGERQEVQGFADGLLSGI